MKSKAIFFDRDDTLIIDINYLHRPEDVEYFSDTMEALKMIDALGYKKFIITNQSGVGRGFFGMKDVYSVYDHLQNDFVRSGIKPFLDMGVCPHQAKDQCQCRKPSPKMILDICQKWDVEPSKSFMVGDKDIDVEAGINAGMKSFKVNYRNNGPTLMDFALSLKNLP